MELTLKGIERSDEWTVAGIELPKYDIETMRRNTEASPYWIHFGAGNIFRAFQANAVQKMLNEGYIDRGVVVAEGFDYEIITKMNKRHDNLSLLATMKSDGHIDKTVVASVAEAYVLDSSDIASYERLKEIFAKDSLQMVTFTITEKGYSLKNSVGKYLDSVSEDIKNGPANPVSYIGKVASLLHHRFITGELPVAMVSMDNCSHNGDKLKTAIIEIAKAWKKNDFVDGAFIQYLEDGEKVSFPWTMIDKITPRPDESVRKMLEADGVENLEPIITGKNTYIAPFVNAEECEYLVIEDDFPNGRPQLEKVGFMFTDRKTVDKVERMKVCTCLNPLHTALAVFGCLLGYSKISDEMKDDVLVKMINTIGYVEGMPVVVNPGIIDPKDFLNTVITERIPNPFMPDTPQRIATDTSQKIPIRFGETIKRYIESPTLEVQNLKIIPLVFAGWLRYLRGVDDDGNPMELSSDPMLERLCPIMQGTKFGDRLSDVRDIGNVLSDKVIFGVGLYEAGLADMVMDYFDELNAGPGAVRATLDKYLG